MASKAKVIGVDVILAIASFKAVAESPRSSTWVAPSEERSSVLRKEAVVMIGENPESLASWMAIDELRENLQRDGMVHSRTVLSERRCTAHDENGLPGILALAILFPGRKETKSLRLLCIQGNYKWIDGNMHRSRLVERDIFRYLKRRMWGTKRISVVVEYLRNQISGRYTVALEVAGSCTLTRVGLEKSERKVSAVVLSMIPPTPYLHS